MALSMNWDDMTFKAADVVKLTVGLIALILSVAKVNNKLDTMGDNQDTIRKAQVEFTKDYNLDRKATETRFNALELEFKIQSLRIDALEKTRIK